MREYVLVEFIAQGDDQSILISRLRNISEIEIIGSEDECEEEEHAYMEWIRITAKVESEFLTMLKLTDPFLAERMRISYISDELKNKYRK